VNDELERMSKEAIKAYYYKVLCQHLPRGTEEKYHSLWSKI